MSADVEDIWVTVESNALPPFIAGAVCMHPHGSSESFDYLGRSFRGLLKKKPLFISGDLIDDLNKINMKKN